MLYSTLPGRHSSQVKGRQDPTTSKSIATQLQAVTSAAGFSDN